MPIDERAIIESFDARVWAQGFKETVEALMASALGPPQSSELAERAGVVRVAPWYPVVMGGASR
jgi:hypothetical protein